MVDAIEDQARSRGRSGPAEQPQTGPRNVTEESHTPAAGRAPVSGVKRQASSLAVIDQVQ